MVCLLSLECSFCFISLMLLCSGRHFQCACYSSTQSDVGDTGRAVCHWDQSWIQAGVGGTHHHWTCHTPPSLPCWTTVIVLAVTWRRYCVCVLVMALHWSVLWASVVLWLPWQYFTQCCLVCWGEPNYGHAILSFLIIPNKSYYVLYSSKKVDSGDPDCL